MIFMPLLCAVGLLLVVWLRLAVVRSRQISMPTWGQLAMKLKPVEKDAIRTLAEEYLKPESTSWRSSKEVYSMLGGVEGLDTMRSNAKVLIALAAYAERWNDKESAAIVERMRHDGQVLRRAVFNLSLAEFCGYGTQRMLDYAMEASVSYQLMRERLLLLYKNNHGGIYPVLVESL